MAALSVLCAVLMLGCMIAFAVRTLKFSGAGTGSKRTLDERQQMKRTLLEILGGLAVLVLLASFHHQIARLQANDRDVAALREMVARRPVYRALRKLRGKLPWEGDVPTWRRRRG